MKNWSVPVSAILIPFGRLALRLGLGAALALGASFAHGADNQVRREVGLDWEPVEGASLYEIKIVRILKGGEKKKPLFFKLKTASWRGNINPGLYEMQLRSYDDRGVPGEWSEASQFWAKIAAPQLIAPIGPVKMRRPDTEKVSFKWQAISGAASYRFELVSDDGKIKEQRDLSELGTNLELPVARSYRWRVTGLMPEGEEGTKSEQLTEFSLIGPSLDKPKVSKPLSKFVQTLEWQGSEFDESYDYQVLRLTPDRKWKVVDQKKEYKGKEIPFDLAHPTGTYKLVVQASGTLREKSQVASIEFPIEGGLRSPAAVEAAMLRESLKKPTHFYAIASYFITQMDYFGENRELSGQSAAFSALGGTGRLGLGYQNPLSKWGYFGIVDLSGFNIGNKNFTFAAAELHATYNINWGANIVRLGGGLSLKELPEVIGNSSTGLKGVGKIENIGPHAGFIFWRPISQRLGLQANGRMYYALSGKSPTGEEVVPTLSYQVGLLGSYRLSENIMGFAGYAYRRDEAAYEAIPFSRKGSGFASEGDVNRVEVVGHYLNLILEYSF